MKPRANNTYTITAIIQNKASIAAASNIITVSIKTRERGTLSEVLVNKYRPHRQPMLREFKVL